MKNSHSAFTLIELLVVITIIAILASIALPVFNGVTERANQTKDLSNAKQIGLALKLFASDNNGAFPSKGARCRLQLRHRFGGRRRFQRRFLVAFPQLLEERGYLQPRLARNGPRGTPTIQLIPRVPPLGRTR